MEILLWLLGGYVIWKVITTKARLYRADKARARKEAEYGVAGKTPPTWVRDGEKIDEMLAMLTVHGQSKSIPKSFVESVISTEKNLYQMLAQAGLMEESGRSFEEQVLSMSDMISEEWRELTVEQRTHFREVIDT